MKNKIVRLLVIIVITLIVIDQLSKILVSSFLKEPVGNEFIGLEIVTNTGMALGFNEGNVKNILLTIFVLLIIIGFVKNQIERIDTKTMVAISLALAGGIGNLIDRFFRGGVLDFIRLYKLPIFNLADAFVVLGWILLVIFIIDFQRRN